VRAVVPWLAARFVDEQGRVVPLPLSLPAGDFSRPHAPWDLRQSQTWRVEISVPDCRLVTSPLASDFEEQLLAVDVDSGARSGTAQLWGGDGYRVVRELTRSACSS
jgi:hypothetical protein